MWGSEPATDKQKATLEKLGIPFKAGLTKLEATVLIDDALKKGPAPGALGAPKKEPEPGKTQKSPSAETEGKAGAPSPGLIPAEEQPLELKEEEEPAEEPKKKIGVGMILGVLIGLGALIGLVKFGMDVMSPAPAPDTGASPAAGGAPTNRTTRTTFKKPGAVTSGGPRVVPMTPTATSTAPPILKFTEERYANGKLKEHGFEKQLTDGQWVRTGVWTNYWANGNINTYGEYRDGQKTGVWPFWIEDGRQSLSNTFDNATAP
ncbi:MAG: hypothetical protein HY360_00900 [Verrucomicrobia bacterium]|nr:hypothetical protein [Verrucomicrobiota bacterium]